MTAPRSNQSQNHKHIRAVDIVNSHAVTPAHTARHDPMLVVVPKLEVTRSEQSTAHKAANDVFEPAMSRATEPELAGLVTDKTYFLPIGGSQAHHYRVCLFFVILVLLVAIIWLDAAQDGGLVHFSVLRSLNHVLHHVATFRDITNLTQKLDLHN